MAKPRFQLEKIKGRTWDELYTRGGQAVAAYTEKFGWAGGVPDDREFTRHVDREMFGTSPIIAESIWQQFFHNADKHFFTSFRGQEKQAAQFRRTFGAETCGRFIETADRIVDGRIDLLGIPNVLVGTDIDWHLEPVSGIRSPDKHWKEFDDLDTRESGDKKIIWELNRHQHFFTLGVAYWLTQDERYADVFVQHLESWIEQNPPGFGINWASSLEAAFRVMSWIWAFHFFRNSDALTPAVFHRAIKILHLHGRHIEKYLSKYYSPNTHLTGEALGLYYLGTQLPFLKCAERWRAAGQQILIDEIERQILDDGVYFEQSTWYQRYTVDFYTHFILLKALFNNEPGGAPADRLERRLGKAFTFLMHITRPDGTTPLIGDDDGGRMLPMTTDAPNDLRGTLASGAVLFGRGDLRSIAGGLRQEVYWLFGSEGCAAYRTLDDREPEETSRGFSEGGYYTMRDGWLDTDSFMAVDCGPLGALSGAHGHADTLSVEFAIRGKTLLIDPGTYSYHESRDLRDYFRSSAAHNTLTIDGLSSSEPGGTFAWASRANATTDNWITNERFDYFQGSHDGYSAGDNPATHTRSVLFLKNDYVIIRDLVRAQSWHSFSLNFHFDRDETLEIDADNNFAAGDGWRMYAFGDRAKWEKRESWASSYYGRKSNAPFVRFKTKARGMQEFFTFLLPNDGATDPPEVIEMPIDGARAFAIKFNGYTDLLVVDDDLRNIVKTELFDTNFKFSWARMGALPETPEEFVLVGGSRLDVAGDEVIGDMGELRFAAIRRMGDTFNVSTDKGRSRVTLRR